MHQQSDSKQLQFQGLAKRTVVAAFDGGTISSDAGALVLREVDKVLGLLERFSRCFGALGGEEQERAIRARAGGAAV